MPQILQVGENVSRSRIARTVRPSTNSSAPKNSRNSSSMLGLCSATASREFFGVEEFVDGLTGLALRERLTFSPTCKICGIHTGYGGPGIKTVLPAHASAWMDFRLVPEQRP